jgi:CMP/dCMP kinase
MQKQVIAIDGFSSTGKSTIAKQLARHLGFVFIDSGAMYRAVTYYAIQKNFINDDFFDKEDLIKSLPLIDLKFIFNQELGYFIINLNGVGIEKQIRTLEVSKYVSQIAELSEVRKKLVSAQREISLDKNIVMDGRDIGTVVFPDAQLKFFITASTITRAQRRYDEMFKKGENVTFDDVLQNIEKRDYIDTHRKDSPLKKADDAIEIDNSHLTREQQFEIIMNHTNLKIQN